MADLPHVRIEVAQHRAWIDGEPLHLPRKVFRLLACLAARPGQLVTYETLLREVWGTDYRGVTKTMHMHISWLRKALGDDPVNPRYITTIRGVGFRMEPGTVEIIDPPQAEAEEAATRVLLVKPGDVLVFGNLGTVPDPERTRAALADLRDQLRLAGVVLFAGDIDMAAVPAGRAGD